MGDPSHTSHDGGATQHHNHTNRPAGTNRNRRRRRNNPTPRRNTPHPAAHLYDLLVHAWGPDRQHLRRQVDRLAQIDPTTDAEKIQQAHSAITASTERAATRYEHRPHPELMPGLPITEASEEIIKAIQEHQVVIVAGETGSGKTTQLPKLALAAGRGRTGLIGHTQPRRIAARSVAARIADEFGENLGDSVGYSVRFTDKTSDDTFIRLMTDGILLSEIGQDRFLNKYDTIIIDEAHERSLNIDFLLGFLRQLLPRRRDLTVIVTSATIDVERFSKAFQGAPVIEVSGRSYPVDIWYRPIEDMPEEVGDHIGAVVHACRELCTVGSGDILVFLSGEREIRDAADALGSATRSMKGPPIEIVPLFARLSAAEQNKVFAPHTGRRIVLATNVAETSLTVPGIRYVVDVGTARISRFSNRLKVQRLPIEPVSQAAANQRAGRCGRVAEGVCIRLYSEEDFQSRPEFTDPEILRTNLASVILTMAALRLGNVESFPFIDPPEARHIRDGRALLFELGALAHSAHDAPGNARGDRVTPVGRSMARLPIDPRLGRMILASAEHGCTGEVLTITAALSIQDPRERPVAAQAQADQCHARYKDPKSDYMTWLNLWKHLMEQQDALSSSAFRRYCRENYLNYVRVREWQDIRGQLRSLAKDAQAGLHGSPRNNNSSSKNAALDVDSSSSHPDIIHQAILTGLLSHVGVWDERSKDYVGARGARFAIFPGSALARKRPPVVMAAELVETSRLWARQVAAIDPSWAETAGEHMIKRVYTEPVWSKKRASVVATEKVLLLGVPLVSDRVVTYSRIDPQFCREEFIRRALVEGDWRTNHRFVAHNEEVLAQAHDTQHRARRHDVVVDDEDLFAFYNRRIPADVVSGRHFDSWWKTQARTHPELLNFTLADVVGDAAQQVDEAQFPSTWRVGAVTLPLSYQFQPGLDADGVTVHVEAGLLNQVSNEGFDWMIPGMREELVTALLRSLPKPLRRQLVPVPDTAGLVCAALPAHPEGESITAAIETIILRTHKIQVTAQDWDWSRVPDHLRPTFRVIHHDQTVAEGKDLSQLQGHAAQEVASAVAEATAHVESEQVHWLPDEPIAEQVEATPGQVAVQGYPGLVVEGPTVALRVFPSAKSAAAAHRDAVVTLILAKVPSYAGPVVRDASDVQKLTLAVSPYPTTAALVADLDAAIVEHVMDAAGPPPRDAATAQTLVAAIRQDGTAVATQAVKDTVAVLAAARATHSAMPKSVPLELLASLTDCKDQLAAVFGVGFVRRAGVARLPDIQRYVTAVEHRVKALGDDAARDQRRMREFIPIFDRFTRLMGAVLPGERPATELNELWWTLQEYRVHVFAPAIRTKRPVSAQRLLKELDRAERALR